MEEKNYLLLESGFRIILEAGDGFLLLEEQPPPGWVEASVDTGAWTEEPVS